LESLRLEKIDIFYDHLEYFMGIWKILCPCSTFCVHLVHFSGFGIMDQEKSGNPVMLLRTGLIILMPNNRGSKLGLPKRKRRPDGEV
jgi:hypothetical protein